VPRLLVITTSNELLDQIHEMCQNGAWEVLARKERSIGPDLTSAEAALVDARDDARSGERYCEQLTRSLPFMPLILLAPTLEVPLGMNSQYYLDPAHLSDLQHILLSLSFGMPQEEPSARVRENVVPRILIVDDNVQLANLIERALRAMERFDVRVVNSGYEAASVLPSFHPDVAVIDLALGDSDGRDICAFIRANDRLKKTRIIAVSGYLSEIRLEDDTTPVNYDAFLEKPFKIKDIVDTIIPLLGADS
jgi:CheY-like chemotaxis protein